MKLKEIIAAILITLVICTQLSCEVDDICLEGTTPQLIVKFYDATITNTTTIKEKKTDDLYVIYNKDTIYKKLNKDSIKIPLNPYKDASKYILEIKKDGQKIRDTLNFNYTRKDVFVSKSCGYKTSFIDTKATYTSHWIKKFTFINNNIENEKDTHLHIYF